MAITGTLIKDRPPAEAEKIAFDDDPAKYRAEDPGGAAEQAENTHHPKTLVRAIQNLHQGEDLRAHHRPAGPLHNTHRDQHFRAGGQPATGRRGAKRQQAANEHPPVAIQIAETAAGKQQNGEKEQVAGDHPFDLPRAGEQVALYHRDGDIDD